MKRAYSWHCLVSVQFLKLYLVRAERRTSGMQTQIYTVKPMMPKSYDMRAIYSTRNNKACRVAASNYWFLEQLSSMFGHLLRQNLRGRRTVRAAPFRTMSWHLCRLCSINNASRVLFVLSMSIMRYHMSDLRNT